MKNLILEIINILNKNTKYQITLINDIEIKVIKNNTEIHFESFEKYIDSYIYIDQYMNISDTNIQNIVSLHVTTYRLYILNKKISKIYNNERRNTQKQQSITLRQVREIVDKSISGISHSNEYRDIPYFGTRNSLP